MSTITHAHIHICIKRELHNSRSCGCLASLPARWTDLVEKWMHGNGGAGEYKIIPSQLNVGWKALLRLAFAAHIYLGVCLNIYSILKINNIYHNFECNFERVVMSDFRFRSKHPAGVICMSLVLAINMPCMYMCVHMCLS